MRGLMKKKLSEVKSSIPKVQGRKPRARGDEKHAKSYEEAMSGAKETRPATASKKRPAWNDRFALDGWRVQTPPPLTKQERASHAERGSRGELGKESAEPSSRAERDRLADDDSVLIASVDSAEAGDYDDDFEDLAETGSADFETLNDDGSAEKDLALEAEELDC